MAVQYAHKGNTAAVQEKSIEVMLLLLSAGAQLEVKCKVRNKRSQGERNGWLVKSSYYNNLVL